MARLEGYGHERRLARIKQAFRRTRVGSGRPNLSRIAGTVGGPLGLLALGAGIGASSFVMLDAIEPPDQSRQAALQGNAASVYQNCREAFQDGRANILRGEPAYRAALDADGDGKACEPYIPLNR